MAPRLLIPTRFVESDDCCCDDGGDVPSVVSFCTIEANDSLVFVVRLLFVVDNVDVDTDTRPDVYDVGGENAVVVQS